MSFFIIAAIIYVAIIAVSYHYFTKWAKDFSGKSELSWRMWAIVIVAAVSVPATIFNCTSLLFTILGWIFL